MKEQKEFMMIFRFNPNTGHQPTAEQLTAMHQAWGAFIGQIALAEKLVSTHRLGSEAVHIASDQSSTPGVYLANNLMVSGNMIVKARSLDEAAEMAKGCPILSMGGSAEVRSIDPM